ncbi:hypothetical protein FS837_011510 [Tulasnella sp. UAMH 9824]|nr:hypothetical protein FS837_011510 [Tulasnella sp. UAMH 9824]
MPSVLNSISNSVKTSNTSTSDSPSTPSSPPLSAIQPKKKFRTFGIASRSRSPAVHNGAHHSDTEDDWNHPVLITTGNESSTAVGGQRRHPSVTDTSFFESSTAAPNASGAAVASSAASKKSQPPSTRSRASSMEVEEMKIDLSFGSSASLTLGAPLPPSSVSIIGIKQIRDGFPTVTLPPFPLANVAIAAPQTPLTPGGSNKRRSSFLHNLTRFANPTSNGKTSKKDGRPSTGGGSSGVPQSPSTASGFPTPTPPAENTADPFNDVSMMSENALTASAGSNVITALAAYLTAVANDSKLRGSRPWKRFIRVRTDDLESVRVERAIKRVRSDLAAHKPSSSISAAAKDMMSRKTMMDVGTGPSMLSLGPSFGVGDLGMAGLSADGGFQSEMDGESEGGASEKGGKTNADDVTQKIPPVPPIPAHLISTGHEKEATAKPTTAALDTSVGGTTTSKADKRVSSVMALQSAFSSDTDSLSKRNSYLQGFGSGTGSAPPTPTPGTAELPSATAASANKAAAETNPEDVELPPSPKGASAELAGEDASVTGLPTPVHSPQPKIPRSHSADPDKAARRFKDSELMDGDTSVAEGGDVTTDAEARSTTTNDAGDPTAVVTKKKSKKRVKKAPAPQKKVTLEDFEMMRVLGKGCAGKVLLVKYKKSSDLYALKSITKRHVLAHQELQHTLTEQAVLKRMSREGKDPFVVKLWWSFHDKDNLYLVMDFHPGGDLATQLARWGRLGRDRARFYAAEIVEGVEGLHAAGVIYRDLKPENILIGSDGHIVLTDFGLSKEFPRRGASSGPATASGTPNGVFSGTDYYAGAPSTDGAPSSWTGSESGSWGPTKDLTSTFCGTAEYLAPEVIQGLPYSYEVDWWSFGTMLYEMLSGITPFWANNHSDMYVRVLQDELQFPEDRAMDQDTKSLIRGLLQRNPALRMSEPRVKRHPYFSMIDWDHVYYKRYIPPYIPPIDPSNASDTQNFDETFLEMEPTVDNDDPVSESEREKTEDEGGRGDGADSVRKAEGTVTDISSPTGETKDVFDGYSFKGRQSVLIDEEDYEAYADEEEEGEDEELVEARKITDALAARHQQPQQPAEPREDVSETGTIEQNKDEPSIQEAISATPSTSTVPESAVSASIVTDADSVVAPKAPKDERKQASESTERSSTIPSLTTGTTGTMSSSKDLTESPTVAESLAQSAAAARLIAEGSFDEAVQAPLPLSPVLEAADLTGPIEDEPLSKAEAKAAPITPVQQRTRGTRREKSGIPVLDRLRREEDDDATERDEDDWDLVETPAMQERNGAKGLNLWQRGVVDRYRLAVFRKSGTSGSTPSRIPRSVSGTTRDSQSVAAAEMSASPSPSQSKQKRGRTGGISLRKSTRDFLRAKSPAANFSTQSSATSRASLAQSSNPAGVNGAGLLTPSPSGPVASTKPVPSLKSKSSALSRASVNSPPSSDQSVTDLRNQHAKSSADVSLSTPVKSPMSSRSPAMRSSPAVDEGDQPRPSNLKKMKKYTEQGAERMFSLFGSPRNQNQQHHS